MKNDPILRRQALALLGLGLTGTRLARAQQHLHTLKTKPDAYKIRFFSADAYRLIDTLCEMILPADEHSPGAREARVAAYIDLIVSHCPQETKAAWRAGWKAWDALAREKFGAPFLSLDTPRREALLDHAARDESRPRTEAERFFADVKKITVFAYYTSEIGLRKELGYLGNAVLGEFPGCPHRPALRRNG